MAMRSSSGGKIEIEVTVTRVDLLERLKTNREKHAREYENAIRLWQQELDRVINSIHAESDGLSDFPDDLFDLKRECPFSHIKEYDRAIDMFSMSINQDIKLDQEAFDTFCRDEWSWKSNVSSNRFYRQQSSS